MTKSYSQDGYLGRVQSHRNRETGTQVSVYQAAQAGIEDDPATPWATVCEDHGSAVCHYTLAEARGHAANPSGWCEACRTALDERGHDEYADIAEELGGDCTLDDIEPRWVNAARAYAERSHRPWPPRPTTSGWQVQVWSWSA